MSDARETLGSQTAQHKGDVLVAQDQPSATAERTTLYAQVRNTPLPAFDLAAEALGCDPWSLLVATVLGAPNQCGDV